MAPTPGLSMWNITLMSDMAFEAAALAVLQDLDPGIQGNRVTVALSGGADSVALCHFLAAHAGQLGITVAAAHLNHGLRGEESDGDEAFVRAFCAKLGLPLICEKLPAGGCASEAALREKRYEFLWRAAGQGFLATGHTLTDSCETLLFHLARGTRLGGMRGIPRQTGKLIRPLITLTREDTEAYCRSQGLAWVMDSSNLSNAYARNRLRHGALPAMRSVSPRAEQAMGAWMQEAEELYAWLDAQAAALMRQAALPDGSWSRTVLAGAADVVLRTALANLLSPYADASAARVALAVKTVRDGGAVEWCAGVRLVTVGDLVCLRTGEQPKVPAAADFCRPAAPGVYHPTPDITVEIREHRCVGGILAADAHKFTEKTRKINKKDLNNLLDYARISSMCMLAGQVCSREAAQSALVLRFRAPGDTFAPGRGRGTKSLKKWFNEIACPPAERGHLPLLAVGDKVVWLAGSGAAEDFAAAEDSPVVWEVLWTTQNVEGSL